MANKAPKKTTHSYWQCKQPEYDARTSCYINCGTDFGVGHVNPVGHHGDAKKTVETLPQHVRTVNPKPDSTVSIVE